MVDDDVTELTKIISEYGSLKQWCTYLHLSGSTCNELDYSSQHSSDKALDVAKAYLDEKVKPCWEDIVKVLCEIKKYKPALKLAEKHGVNFSSLCKH